MANINGTDLNDVLVGAATNDIIDGGAGNDNIDGAAGDDFLIGGLGDDSINGGLDTDTASLDYATSQITALSGAGSNLFITGTEGSDSLINIELFQFSDQTVSASEIIVGTISDDALNGTSAADLISADSGNDTISAGAGFDRIWGGTGVNTIDGGTGNDTAVFDYASSSISSLSSANNQLTVISSNSTDILSNIETLQFSDQIIQVSTLILGTASAQTINGTDSGDVIAAGAGADTISAGGGNDLIVGAEDGETIDGGTGEDTVKFNFSQSDLTGATRLLNGDLQLTTEQPTTLLSNVENIAFADQSVITVDALVSTFNTGTPLFYLSNAENNALGIAPEAYVGPVTYLEYQLFGDATSNVVSGSSSNDFFNLLGGNDAATGGDGLDVLDGGTGSNFLTGGNGADTFFLDGRGGETTWSTITDFTNGDNVNIWGWQESTSQLILMEESNGAAGFEGVTLHYDLDGDGNIDTSLTFSGLTSAQLPSSEAKEVADNGYLLFSL